MGQPRRHKPSDYGIGVTICAAAVCEDGRGIVAVCDRLISIGSVTSDAVLKAHRIHGTRWVAFVAGNDVGYASGVFQGVRDLLSGSRGTSEDVRRACEEICAKEIQRKIQPILTKWGVTREQVLAGPTPSLHPSVLNTIKAALNKEDSLECSFLVCGFGPEHSDEGTILEISPQGTIRQFHDQTGYWAIGSGSDRALNAFLRRQYGPRTKFPVCIYCVCEAKFSAERVKSVGRRTWLFLIDQDGVHVQMGETKLMSDIRKACRAFRPVPSRLTRRIAGIIPQRFNEYE